MTRAAAPAAVKVSEQRTPRRSAGRVVVLGVLGLVAALAVGLLAASLVPGNVLAGRLLGASTASGGAFTQEFIAQIGGRLRLAAGLLLFLAAGLGVFRVAFEDLVQ